MLEIAAWQCCKCNFAINPIIDSDINWFADLDIPGLPERCDNRTHQYNIRAQPQRCPHHRCDSCIDLSPDGVMLRYCDGVMPEPGGPMPPRYPGHETVQDPWRPMDSSWRGELERAVRRVEQWKLEREGLDRMSQMLERALREEMLPEWEGARLRAPVIGSGDEGVVMNTTAAMLGDGNSNSYTNSSSNTLEDDNGNTEVEGDSLQPDGQSLVVIFNLPSGPVADRVEDDTSQDTVEAQHAVHANQTQQALPTQNPAPTSATETNIGFRGEQLPRTTPEALHLQQTQPTGNPALAPTSVPETDPPVRRERIPFSAAEARAALNRLRDQYHTLFGSAETNPDPGEEQPLLAAYRYTPGEGEAASQPESERELERERDREFSPGGRVQFR
ncbi:hypothetical protein ONS95_001568 [Cadophora gregata]|uniref:uncharacterized protein n=1 Tax=Cadophora gregata TaxID=51156 RepID=UPI0026DD160D|nr:uncharacterized protein ONS95_001568 [Cadophora gregata]KAK0111193.1 hypothetical protein ONS95_001568 [Cadophora gregata]KAK0112334.1 hypothetical protein ONS96_001582 [Cadophora gregata f. sp. sojae]